MRTFLRALMILLFAGFCSNRSPPRVIKIIIRINLVLYVLEAKNLSKSSLETRLEFFMGNVRRLQVAPQRGAINNLNWF